MLRRSNIYGILSCFIALLTSTQISFADEQANKPTEVQDFGVKLSIELPNNNSLLCEPLFLSVILENSSDNDLIIPQSPGSFLIGTFVDIYIKRPNASTFEKYLPLDMMVEIIEYYHVGPEEKIRLNSAILSDRHANFLLDETGNYEVYAEWKVKGKSIESGNNIQLDLRSNTMTFNVSEPKSTDEQALELWKLGFGEGETDFVVRELDYCGYSLEVLKAKYSKSALDDVNTGLLNDNILKDLQAFEELRKEYPNTIYGKYSCFYNALNLGNSLGSQEYKIELESYLNLNPAFPLEELLLESLGSIYARQQDYQSAIRVYQSLIDGDFDTFAQQKAALNLKEFKNRVKNSNNKKAN